MIRFVLHHSLLLAFYKSLAAKGTFYSWKDGAEFLSLFKEINWWDGRDRRCKVAVCPLSFLSTVSAFHTADGIRYFLFFCDWELRWPVCFHHLGPVERAGSHVRGMARPRAEMLRPGLFLVPPIPSQSKALSVVLMFTQDSLSTSFVII